MRLTKCANGHFYDEEKYSSCPHCSGGAGNGGFGGDDMTTESFVNPATATVGPNRAGGFGNFGDDDVTISDAGFGGGRNMESTEPLYNSAMRQQKPAPSPAPASAPKQAPSAAPSMDDDGKTVGFINWDAIKENEAKQKEGQSVSRDAQRREYINPVVGWLVCISGSNYGKSFCLYSGKNFIGRDVSNDVCLTGDNSISRIKHAVIIYEPKMRQFFAQPGDSSHELFYLNNSVVLSNTLLTDRDVVTLGQTSLVFVPFCDEKYGWDIIKPE